MLNLKEFYITGIPVDTDIGKAHFIKVRDYPDIFMDLQIVAMSKLEIIYKYSEINKDGSLDRLLEELKKLDLYDITTGLPELKEAYYNVFSLVYKDDKAVAKIGRHNFETHRQTVMDMNCIQEEEINPNPEIQRHLERSKRVKAQEAGKLTFADMCSSIVVNGGKTYEDLLDYTIYQFYMTFYRISQFKSYDASTLFATVPTDKKVEIESWSKHIDLYAKESHVIDGDRFKREANDILR